MRKLDLTTKSALVLFLGFLLLFASVSSIIPSVQASDPQELWALIICGSEGLSFSNNTQYMYHVLTEHYNFDDAVLLSLRDFPSLWSRC